ncbi:MAG TPA: hypothetical protein VFJ24_07120 [Gaiellales bacterium]|nr:hypothetical protein [Gaiellales bacterium]
MLDRLALIARVLLTEVERTDPESRERVLAAFERACGDLGDLLHEVRRAIAELRRT